MYFCCSFKRNVCLWDTLISPGNSLIHGELKECCPGFILISEYSVYLQPENGKIFRTSGCLTKVNTCGHRIPTRVVFVILLRKHGMKKLSRF
jgi:hypothetical protein